MPPPSPAIIGPTALRLKPVLHVTEQLGYWVKGTLIKVPSMYVELSFESYKELPVFPGSWFTYLRISGGPQTFFEFQLGKLIHSEPVAIEHVYDLINIGHGHDPIPVTDRPTEETINMKRIEQINRVSLMPRLPKI